jgi:hypothetical protein
LALLLGLRLVIERRVIEHSRHRFTGRLSRHPQRRSRLILSHRLDRVALPLLRERLAVLGAVQQGREAP